MLKSLILSLLLVSLWGCIGPGEQWQPNDGVLTPQKQKLFAADKRECFLRIEDAQLAGLEDKVARMAYYHCMQNKGWNLVD